PGTPLRALALNRFRLGGDEWGRVACRQTGRCPPGTARHHRSAPGLGRVPLTVRREPERTLQHDQPVGAWPRLLASAQRARIAREWGRAATEVRICRDQGARYPPAYLPARCRPDLERRR